MVDRLAQPRISRSPHGRVVPFAVLVGLVNQRIKRGIGDPAGGHVPRVAPLLVAEALAVVAGGGHHPVKRLRPRRHAERQRVPQRPVRLRVQLVEDQAGHVVAVVDLGIGREHLIDAVGGRYDDPILARDDLAESRELRRCADHLHRDVKAQLGLVAAGGGAVDLGRSLAVRGQQVERDPGA